MSTVSISVLSALSTRPSVPSTRPSAAFSDNSPESKSVPSEKPFISVMPSSSANVFSGIMPISCNTPPCSLSIESKSFPSVSISTASSTVALSKSFSPSMRIASPSLPNPIGIGPGAASVIPAPSVDTWLFPA